MSDQPGLVVERGEQLDAIRYDGFCATHRLL
jgi:hypothetical protein